MPGLNRRGAGCLRVCEDLGPGVRVWGTFLPAERGVCRYVRGDKLYGT